MFSPLARRMIDRSMRALNAGDIEPTLRIESSDIHFRFPGDSSWAADIRGKDAHRRWLERMARTGIHHDTDEVVLQGMPWRQTLCLRGRDHVDDPAAGRVYENRYVIWGTLRWGRLVAYEVYEDTQASKAFDGWLEAREGQAVPVGP